MDSDTLLSIGELSRRTGLTVKTVRFYSDTGIVPPTGRSPAGYRLYGPGALARLRLARTLRDLGLDLATVRRVLDREASLEEVTEAHADAPDVQIRTLRLRRAVLRAIARSGPTTPMEMDLMHRLATLSRAERHRLVSDFLDDAFEGVHANPEFDRAMAERIDEADRAGLLPASADGASPADVLAALYADAFARAGEGDLGRWLLARLRTTTDPDAERYWRLLATVNGWPASPALAPLRPWFTSAFAPSGGGPREGAVR
ncbi:MerR family transcriptional regulator [Streptomyces erythrochromogenes]|uniref:MerR family transcriptional regulator n=1 Tax=Streptomyces erythrochromogenes TaxID=285574 RepID=UPI0036C38D4E